MTLPASGSISLGQVAAELGIGLPLSLGDSRVRNLAGVASGPISLGQLRGKSGVAPLSATSTNDSGYASTVAGGGTVSCSPRVTAGGGTGVITYLWVFTSNPNGCTLSNATSAACTVSKTYTQSSNGVANATLRCTVRDGGGTGATVIKDNISAGLLWDTGA